jgi:hypothetical protein
MYSPLVFDPVNLFAAQSVAASTTSDPSDRLETTRLTKVQVRVKQKREVQGRLLIHRIKGLLGGLD